MLTIFKKDPILSIVNGMIVDLAAPSNISYLWNFGSLLGICLVVQILTGVFLAMHYTAHVDLAFQSVEHIMRDVNKGWLIRYLHTNGASMFFIMVYLHIARGLYHGSYTTLLVSATVITNMLLAIPRIGNELVQWVWGGFSVDNATLNRLYSFHYLLLFLLAALVVVHLLALHVDGSSSPLGVSSNVDKVPLNAYYSYKDLFRAVLFFIFFATHGIVIEAPVAGFVFLAGVLLKLGAYGFIRFPFHGTLAHWLGTLAALLTTFYSFRLIYLAFINTPNSSFSHSHEPVLPMMFSLAFLAFCFIFVGYLFKDLFIGLGSPFFSSAIFALPSHPSPLDSKFIPSSVKLLPLTKLMYFQDSPFFHSTVLINSLSPLVPISLL